MVRPSRTRPLLLLLCALLTPHAAWAQSRPDVGLMGTALQMRKLDGVKRVLMIGAHPDDEDTGLLASLARGSGVETAYLSLSRGEGGQSLIGPELHEGLGIVRTGELVSARALDGGAQFFTRAFDFGYSKTIDEALAHWPEEDVLRDVVYVVRKFRPHVIVAVFSGTVRDGHGQHQVAGVAARRAFEDAGNPDRFPELGTMGVEPWTPSKLYRSARFSPQDATLSLETGTFDPVMGRSHFQVAMDSRSQHRSQDMGVNQYMGPRQSPLLLVDSRVTDEATDSGIFAGVDTTFYGQLPQPLPPTWPYDTEGRLERYRHALRDAEARLSALDPSRAAPSLMEARALLEGLVEGVPDGPARQLMSRRMEALSEVILSASGVVTDVRIGRGLLTPGESVVVDVNVWNGGPFDAPMVKPELLVPDGWSTVPTEESALGPPASPFFRPAVPETPEDGIVPAGSIARWSWTVGIPKGAGLSAPYYLEHARTGDLYAWPEDPSRWARPFDPAPIRARIDLSLARPDGSSAHLRVDREGEYVGVDKAAGEYREAPLVVPAVSVEVEPDRMIWPAGERTSRAVTVILTSTGTSERSGVLRLLTPDGFTAEPAEAPYSLAGEGTTRAFVFEVVPSGPVPAGTHVFRAVAKDEDGRTFDVGHEVIDYPHIRRVALIHPARVSVSAFPVVADTDLRVGYVMGSGDGGAAALSQIGMDVELLGEDVVREGNFDAYDVLVLGVRAYETRPDLVQANDEVLAFAERGGTVIVQYNKYEFPAGNFAPYPVAMSRPHDRVADEEAPMRVLEPESPVFRGPNDLSDADFEGWVQERGLYFLNTWDERFTPVLETSDPGEDPKRGGLVVAPVGDGLYVYTGLAFFRQFPTGVPGAHRLFANLVSMRAADWKRARTAS